jgi:hypothetical protein
MLGTTLHKFQLWTEYTTIAKSHVSLVNWGVYPKWWQVRCNCGLCLLRTAPQCLGLCYQVEQWIIVSDANCWVRGVTFDACFRQYQWAWLPCATHKMWHASKMCIMTKPNIYLGGGKLILMLEPRWSNFCRRNSTTYCHVFCLALVIPNYIRKLMAPALRAAFVYLTRSHNVRWGLVCHQEVDEFSRCR